MNVSVGSAKEFLSVINGELLHLVNKLATAVVALARVPLSVLVGLDRPLCGGNFF